jgi:two-component system, NtrC family, sensor kinase
MIILVLEEFRRSNVDAFQQIEEQKSHNTTLRSKIASTEDRFRKLFDHASEGIIIANATSLEIIEVNRTAQRMLGLAHAEAAQKSIRDFCHVKSDSEEPPKDSQQWCDWVCRQPRIELISKSGTATVTEVDGALIELEGRPAFQFFFREMTERARLEQQLRQAEKLSALGQMISGVAHELNNPLAIIKGYLDLILAKNQLEPQTRTELKKIVHESNRAAKLVRNFLAFAREQPAHREMVNINTLIERVTELRKFDLLVNEVHLTLELADDLPVTYADPDQAQQIILNLINNSVQAMERQPSPRLLSIRSFVKSEAIHITLEDNGPGVPPELESRIFEPFFTTKEVGTGTGLGLSIAHSIMSDHHGKIHYSKSSLGGAGFFLEFPIVSSPPRTIPPEAELVPTPVAAKNAANILVLDDERAIAELLSEMLGLIGHHPTLAFSPVKALELLDQTEFDLILSDFRMPVMNGQEFHSKVMEKNPELARRIIFLTGDTVNEETHDFLTSAGNPNLAKPFQLATLERVVSETLAKATADCA